MSDRGNSYGLFDPYVRIPSGPGEIDDSEERSDTIRALLADRARVQAISLRGLLARKAVESLPAVLRGLDRETRGVATATLQAMIAAFERALTLDAHADLRERLDPVFRPIGAWVRGRYAVTSPALLVVQSILYSHCEWFREQLWEAHSADRAYTELRQAGMPKHHCQFVAAIIAHQTLLRTAWSLGAKHDPRETFVGLPPAGGREAQWAEEHFRDKPECTAEVTAQAIGASLFPFLSDSGAAKTEDIPPQRRRLAAAAVLHALCLHARHHRHRIEEAGTSGVKAEALRCFNYLIELPVDSPEATPALVHIQYGRYLHRANKDAFKELRKALLDKLNPDIAALNLCLPRVDSRNVWAEHDFDKSSITKIDPGFSADISVTLNKTVGVVLQYEIRPRESLARVLGLDPKDVAQPSTGNSYALFADLKKAVSDKHLAYRRCLQGEKLQYGKFRYLPAPLVGQLLNVVRHHGYGDFAALHLIAQEPRALSRRGRADEQLTLWLPMGGAWKKELPTNSKANDSKANVWNQSLDDDPKALVARYVAAMMIGLLVSYAPRRLLLDYCTESARTTWGEWIRKAFKQNGGPLMTRYVEQLRARRAEVDVLGAADAWGITSAPGERRHAQALNGIAGLAEAPDQLAQSDEQMRDGELTIIGLDIGGTSIKAALFLAARGSEADLPLQPLRETKTVKWDEVKEGTNETATPESLLKKCLEKLEVGSGSVNAIGIALAAPVADGVPVGWSGVLGKFGRDEKIWHSNPHKLHELDFAAAADGLGLHCPVVLLNDGDADIRSDAHTIAAADEGRILVLKEGTGVAFALYEDGRPVDCLGETAKAVVNLLCTSKPSSDADPPPFQEGQLGAYLSRKKLRTLVPGLKEKFKEKGVDLSALAEPDLIEDEITDIANFALGGLLRDALLPKQQAAEADVDNQKTPDAKYQAEEAARSALVSLGKSLFAQCEAVGLTESLHEAVRKDSVADGIAALGRACGESGPEDTATLREKCAGLPDPPTWEGLCEDQQAAVACAWVLGRWLADAIALCWELYRIREVRLAGGPLRDATGLYIAASARDALRDCYGFDIDTQHGRDDHPAGLDWYASMRRREIKSLRVVDPPASSDKDVREGGPLGAALTAFDAYWATRLLKQLRACRNEVAEMDGIFDAVELIEKASSEYPPVLRPFLVTAREVAEMLEGESAMLGLTRERDGRFRRWD